MINCWLIDELLTHQWAADSWTNCWLINGEMIKCWFISDELLTDQRRTADSSTMKCWLINDKLLNNKRWPAAKTPGFSKKAFRRPSLHSGSYTLIHHCTLNTILYKSTVVIISVQCVVVSYFAGWVLDSRFLVNVSFCFVSRFLVNYRFNGFMMGAFLLFFDRFIVFNDKLLTHRWAADSSMVKW